MRDAFQRNDCWVIASEGKQSPPYEALNANTFGTMKSRASVLLIFLLAIRLSAQSSLFGFVLGELPDTVVRNAAINPVWIRPAGIQPTVEVNTPVQVGFQLPASLTAGVEQFRKTGKGINPFDPEMIDVRVQFSKGSEVYTVYAYYYEAFVRDSSTIVRSFTDCPTAAWKQVATPYSWRANFAPPSAGQWIGEVQIFVPAIGTRPYYSEVFACQAVQSKGFRYDYLSVADDRVHLVQKKMGLPFFALGQDIAWPDGERFRGGAYPAYPNLIAGGYADVLDWVDNLSANGGNMVRVVNVPWSYELEWDTVGVYQMDHAWELDALFTQCEKRNVKMIFALEHGTYSLPTNAEEHLDWRKHPYHRFLPGIEMPEDFMTDENARKHYRNKLRYFLARWGYSSSLGILQLLSEMEHWALRGPNIRLQDNKSAQRKFLDWHNEMLQYAKQQVTYRSLLTGTSYGAAPRDYAINAFSSPFVDVVCPKHCYFTERNDNVDRFNEINNRGLFEKGIRGLFPDKPAIIDETGFGSYVGDPNDIDACNDVTYHNTLWATSFMGTAGAGLYWWRWGSNEYRGNNFPALSAFFADVDFVNYNMVIPAHWEDASRAANVSIETFYTLSDDRARSRCIGWVHNASYWWGNISQDCKDRSGKSTRITTKTRDDAKITAPRELPARTTFEVHDLASRASYNITWYSTRETGRSWSGGVVKTNGFGVARITWIPGAGDYGFRMELVL